MSNTIDCSRMSHASCTEGRDGFELGVSSVLKSEQAVGATTQASKAQLRDLEGRPVGGGASYECVNDCVSSQGVTALVSGATISLGCLMVPPACPALIGSGVGLLIGACEVACEDLESRP